MPETEPRTTTAIRVPLELQTFQLYEQEAGKQKLPVEEICRRRLQKCRTHEAVRGFFFNDAQRNELEKLLGGHQLKDADHALQRIREAFQIKVDDVAIQLDSSIISRIKSRLRRDKPFNEQLAAKMQYLVQAWIRGEV